MNQYISIADVLQLLRLGRKSTITVCSYDRNRNTGGERLTYNDVTLVDNAKSTRGHARADAPAPVSSTKNPHHRFNKTVNIQTKSGDVISIHPVLIEVYNGQRVIL